MADVTDVSQMPLAGPGPNAPDSGTYGAKAQTDALKKAIGMQSSPSSGPATDAPPMSALPGGAKPTESGGPFGLPPSITAPTQQPNVPGNTPLAQPANPVATAGTASQKNLALLDMLSRNPDVSDSTREWAQLVLKRMVEATRQ